MLETTVYHPFPFYPLPFAPVRAIYSVSELFVRMLRCRIGCRVCYLSSVLMHCHRVLSQRNPCAISEMMTIQSLLPVQ